MFPEELENQTEKCFTLNTQDVLPTDWPIHMHCFSDNPSVGSMWRYDWPNMMFGVTPSKFVNLSNYRIFVSRGPNPVNVAYSAP